VAVPGGRREQQVLAEHLLLRLFPRGGEAGDFGEVALARRVVAGQIVGEFVDPLRDQLAGRLVVSARPG
jgi:hypothetical protein